MALCFDHSLYVRFPAHPSVHPEEKGRGETPFTKNISFASVFILAAVLDLIYFTGPTKMSIDFRDILVVFMQFSLSLVICKHLKGLVLIVLIRCVGGFLHKSQTNK